MDKFPSHEVPVMQGKDAWHKQVELDVADGIPIVVSLLDIDELKGVNDERSHVRGDETISDLLQITGNFVASIPGDELPDTPLLGIGQSRKARSRQHTIRAQPGHIGGDEIAILWYGVNEAFVNTKMAELRGLHDDYLAEDRNQDLLAIGVRLSYGTAALIPGMTKNELMKLVDDRLRIDKIDRIIHTLRQKAFLRVARVMLRLANVRPRSSQKHFDAIDYHRKQRRNRLRDPKAF